MSERRSDPGDGGRARSVARWVQRRSGKLLDPLESALRPTAPPAGTSPMIVIAAGPRSGSTLLYQLLVHALEVDYLSNFHYVMHRHPHTAFRFGRVVVPTYRSTFRSHYGFVTGLNGPAEAERFWEHWLDQSLTERTPLPDPDRVSYILSWWRSLFAATRRPFVAGYIAHTFYVEQMLDLFHDALIVCLRRDVVSVARSLLTLRTEHREDPRAWFSMLPQACRPWLGREPHDQVAAQAFHIDRALSEIPARFGEATLALDYRTLCADPRGTLDAVISAMSRRGLEVRRRRAAALPRSFPPSVHAPADDPAARRIAEALEALGAHTHL